MRSYRTNPVSRHADRPSYHRRPKPPLDQKISGLVNTIETLRSLEAQHRAAGETEDADYFAEAIARRERELKSLAEGRARH